MRDDYDVWPAYEKSNKLDPSDTIVRNIIFAICHPCETEDRGTTRYRRKDVIEAGRRIRDHFLKEMGK